MLDKITAARAELARVQRGAPGYPALDAVFAAIQDVLEELSKSVVAWEKPTEMERQVLSQEKSNVSQALQNEAAKVSADELKKREKPSVRTERTD